MPNTPAYILLFGGAGVAGILQGVLGRTETEPGRLAVCTRGNGRFAWKASVWRADAAAFQEQFPLLELYLFIYPCSFKFKRVAAPISTADEADRPWRRVEIEQIPFQEIVRSYGE